jgi:glyoxylase-like metal-dependent hydrolase (beta-lactamase superfamily II)
MATNAPRNPRSATRVDWYVDHRCIDCGASREVAPGLIVERDGQSVFARQPETAEELRAAWRAMVVCPTASVRKRRASEQPPDLFPQELAPGVYRCGYNARSSFGAHSYFVQRAEGNLLIDSPRYLRKLMQAFESLGGISKILLSHRDDVADADRYARHFGAHVCIHEDDRSAAPYATCLLNGIEKRKIAEDLVAIPTPGHTRGSAVYLWKDTYLFTGDSFAWSPAELQLIAFRDACWYSWDELKCSLERLTAYEFEWVLPGHGHSVHLSAAEMDAELRALVERM